MAGETSDEDEEVWEDCEMQTETEMEEESEMEETDADEYAFQELIGDPFDGVPTATMRTLPLKFRAHTVPYYSSYASLLEERLPWLRLVTGLPKSSTKAATAFAPSEILPWLDFEKELEGALDDAELHQLDQLDHVRLQHPQVPVKSEECVRSCLRSVLGFLNDGLHELGYADEGFYWEPGKANPPCRGIPDFQAVGGAAEALITLEVKLRNNLPMASFERLRHHFENQGPHAYAAISQLHGYLTERESTFGVLSCYEVCFFVKRVGEILYSTEGYAWTTKGEGALLKTLLKFTLMTAKKEKERAAEQSDGSGSS